MKSIPSFISNSKEIKTFINDMISYYPKINDFWSLDDIHQDQFVAHCIRALGCDVDIFLNREGNQLLVNSLLSFDPDNEIELIKSLKESVREQFCYYFDEMFNDIEKNQTKQSTRVVKIIITIKLMEK